MFRKSKTIINRLIFVIFTIIIISKISLFPSLAQITDAQTSNPSLNDKIILNMERDLEEEFENYFGNDLHTVDQTSKEIGQILSDIGEQTNTKPGVLWVIPRETHLHLVLITPNGEAIIKDLYDVPKSLFVNKIYDLMSNITNLRRPIDLEVSQQLHNFIIEPFEEEYLQAQGIDTILFCLGNGGRGLPLGALYDGEKFLIEKYSVTRIPAFNLINTEYKSMRQGNILAMGASEFEDETQAPLLGVPLELQTIVEELKENENNQESWQDISFVNQNFTLDNFIQSLNQNSFNIVHLATHADFQDGNTDQSYIQFVKERLTLDDFDEFDWGNSPLELLVLSACNTALGNEEAELGFAGLALQSGVKTVLGSLWYISDAGTLALMSEFYHQLTITSTKGEALRQTQIKMLRGEIYVEDNQLILSDRVIPIPENLINSNNYLINSNNKFSHPYYWSSFTLISSPW